MKERNYTVDLFKYICAIAVIAIHTAPFSAINERLNFFIVQILARLAVPFFAVCSGYFALGRLGDENISSTEARNVFLQQWKKLIFIYAVWTLLYLLFSIPRWIEIGWFSAWAFVDFGIAAVRSESHYHLWYFLSLIYAWPLFYFCIRKIKRSYWIPISMVLYLVEAVKYCYKMFLPEMVSKALSVLSIWNGLTTGLILLLPFLLMGAYVYGEKEKSRKYAWCGFIISFLLLSLEVVVLHYHGQNNVSYVLMTYPVAYFFFMMVIGAKQPSRTELCKELGVASTFIYCFHPMLVESLERIDSISPMVRFIVTAIVSTILGIIINRILKPILRRRRCFH